MTATPSPQNDTLQIKAAMLAGKRDWPTTKEDIHALCKEQQWIFRAMRGGDVRKYCKHDCEGGTKEVWEEVGKGEDTPRHRALAGPAPGGRAGEPVLMPAWRGGCVT